MIRTNYGPDICQILEEQDTGLGQQANLVSGLLTKQTNKHSFPGCLFVSCLLLWLKHSRFRAPTPQRWARSLSQATWGEGQHRSANKPAPLGPGGSSVSAARGASSAGQPIRSRVCGAGRRPHPPYWPPGAPVI